MDRNWGQRQMEPEEACRHRALRSPPPARRGDRTPPQRLHIRRTTAATSKPVPLSAPTAGLVNGLFPPKFPLLALHWLSPPVYVRANRPGLTCGVSHVKGAAEEHEVAEEGTEVEAGDPVLRRRILGAGDPGGGPSGLRGCCQRGQDVPSC